ncbi:hypothetical protein BGX31_005132 [Mortierella sp. GBA43]|nr:hypothetical protein BGX31_005132 [Mortierella sp. GBA43]
MGGNRYIPAEYRANLSKYKYSGVDESLLSRYVLGPYWTKLVTFFPITMAPNLITGLGFLCVVFNLLTMFYFAPDMTAACPSWAYFSPWTLLTASRPGEQEHRVLWENSLIMLEVILAANALQLGQSWWSVLSHLMTLGNFYLTTWEEYHTGTLYLSAFSGPVEGIIIIVLLYIITGFAGAEFWLQSIRTILGLSPNVLSFIPDMQVNHFFIAFGTFGLGGNVLTALQHVVKARREKNKPVLPALVGLVPFVGISFVAYAWLTASPYIVTEHLVPWILYIGLSFGYTVGLMITAHVTHQPFPLFNISFVPLIFGAVNANLPAFGIERILGHHLENVYLWSCLAFSAAAYAHFAVNVVNDICDYYDIWCFTIKHPKKSE